MPAGDVALSGAISDVNVLLTHARQDLTHFEDAVQTLSVQLDDARTGQRVAAHKVERLAALVGELDTLSCDVATTNKTTDKLSQSPRSHIPWSVGSVLFAMLAIMTYRFWPAIVNALHVGWRGVF